MEILHVQGIEGARRARGLVVVIDVFRAFTVSAYALAGGATECLLVTEVAEAKRLAAAIPGAVISAEVGGLPIPGIAISNSPTLIQAADLEGRTLVQRTSSGTQAVAAAAREADTLIAACLVVAAATARRIAQLRPRIVTMIATGLPDHEEDQACAAYIAALLLGEEAKPEEIPETLRRTPRCRRLAEGSTPGFPATDVELALAVDRFDFALPISRRDGHFRITAG